MTDIVISEFGLTMRISKFYSALETDIIEKCLRIALNDIHETRVFVHNDENRFVTLNDLPEQEQELVRKHLYGEGVAVADA